MALDPAAVRHIARLARLALPEAEITPVQAELERLLVLVGEMQGADVDGVEPMAHPLDETLPLREDRVSEGDRHAELLALAAEAQGGFYLVPKVIE